MNYREILEDFVNNENTEYCYDWQGFDYKTILPCIEQLLKNENNLQSKIDKAIEYIEKSMNNPQPFYEYLFGDENGKVENLDKLLDILKENK